MKTIEIYEAFRVKNSLLKSQTTRIKLLEEKISELRKKYFKLKYDGMFRPVKPAL